MRRPTKNKSIIVVSRAGGTRTLQSCSLCKQISFCGLDKGEIVVCRFNGSITSLTRGDNRCRRPDKISCMALADLGYIWQREFEPLPSGKNVEGIRRK
jgi:hypothetical protein